MRQRQAQTALQGNTARTALVFIAAGMAFSGCDGPLGGQSGSGERSPPITEASGPGRPAAMPAAAPSKAVATAQKTADAASASTENSGPDEKPPQTMQARLLSAATSKVWEIRERINATPEQDLHITVTLSVGAGGHPVSVMGATASTGRGGASRDVADILALDTSGLSMPASGAKRTTTESVIIKGE